MCYQYLHKNCFVRPTAQSILRWHFPWGELLKKCLIHCMEGLNSTVYGKESMNKVPIQFRKKLRQDPFCVINILVEIWLVPLMMKSTKKIIMIRHQSWRQDSSWFYAQIVIKCLFMQYFLILLKDQILGFISRHLLVTGKEKSGNEMHFTPKK